MSKASRILNSILEAQLGDEAESYREAVEGQMGSLVDLLIQRNQLLNKVKKSKDKNLISTVTGGDKYLKSWIGAKVKKGRAVTELQGIRDDGLLKFVKKEEKKQDTSDAFEEVVQSLKKLYKLSADVLESSFYVEGKNIVFDIGY